MIVTASGNERDALRKLEQIQANTSTLEIWQQVLRTYNTWDYRPLANAKDPSQLERIAWFSAVVASADLNMEWEKLTKKDLELPDFVRVANCGGYSVQTGHVLSRLSLQQEQKEIKEIYASSRGKELKDRELVEALNQLPERCFTTEGKRVEVRVIGWGQWAMLLQRHLCHSIQQTYYFMNQKLGWRDEAKEFSAQCDQKFSGLRLYPFVRRLTAADEASYRQSVDDGFAVTVATPHLVSPDVWNYLCWKPSFAELYSPNPNPHVNEWHKHNPPPGTVYNIHPRLHHPSLVNREDIVAILEQLHAAAPHNQTIARNYTDYKYPKVKATYDQLVEIYGPVLDYNPYPMLLCANAIKDQPEKYEALMLKVCALNPARYTELADYFYYRTNLAKAIYYAEQRFELDPDKVGVSHRVGWMISYYLENGNQKRAKELADFGGEVYSSGGLLAKAGYYEQLEQYQSAFEWYIKNEDRYGHWRSLVNFCLRYRTKTDDNRFHSEVEKRVSKIFPKGFRKVTLDDYSAPPKFAVSINEDSDLLREVGLKKGDVIVAVDGIAVNGILQYSYIRDANDSPQLDLIVWDGNQFREVNASPPNRRFKANFDDYRAE
jgi:tetratricopeptide (TPR) repeat protein